ncbi:sialidase [Halobacteriales archaeon QH_8_67_27]|nr:MAG: sialidase [Halobacteriales archaeon QH_8_67_27]
MERSQVAVVATVVLLVAAPGVVGAVTDHEVTGNPGIDVSVPNTDVQPGEQTSLRVVVLNDGNVTSGSVSNPQLEQEVTTARALRVSVDDDHDVPLTVETNERAVGQLPDGSSAPVEFRIDVDQDAQPGTYDLPVNVTYNYTQSVDPETSEYDRTTETRNFTVDLTVEESAQFRVRDVESTARIGATGTVDVTLENTGTAPAYNASVALDSQNADLTFGQATTSSRFVGGTWEPGERRTVSYRVGASQSASEQRYAFAATVSYDDEDETPMQSRSLSLGVTPEPEQSFSIVETGSDVAVDDDGPVNVTVRNDGPAEVRDASVTITSGSNALVFGGSASASQYVGAWAPNETRTVTVEATATPDAEARSYSLQATVGYEDTEGDPGESGTLQFGVEPDPEVEYEFAASDVSSDLRVGEEGTVTGTIENTGDATATGVVVRFETDTANVSPLEREYSVGTLEPGQSETFSFDVEISEAAEAGPKQFTMRPTYRNDDDERREAESFDVRQQVGEQRDVFDLSVTNATVERGSARLVEVTVTNAGEEPVEDVSAALFADDPVSIDDGEAYAEQIEPGESETLTFEVSTGGSALTKSYPVEMDFEYDEPDGDTKLSSGYTFAVDVTEPSDDGGGLPLSILAVLAVVVVGVGGYLRYGR